MLVIPFIGSRPTVSATDGKKINVDPLLIYISGRCAQICIFISYRGGELILPSIILNKTES